MQDDKSAVATIDVSLISDWKFTLYASQRENKVNNPKSNLEKYGIISTTRKIAQQIPKTPRQGANLGSLQYRI